MPDLLERLRAALAGRYAVESEVGRGGMATVLLARDLKHKRQVAIKVLHPELAATVGADRFLREIETVAGLDHPHILPLHDSGEADGLLYYVMPYVEGESLRERLEREEQLPIDQALSIAVEVADGLAYAHRQGVIHRDIKPGNILLAEGHARIADFGVARALGVASERDATATGLAVGTPKYMSPEQASGGDVDGRSDIYALGCVLFEMLAGEPPFDAPTPLSILARKASETVPGLRIRRKTVSPGLEAVVARAMATAPADRFGTADEFAEALKAPERVGRAKRRRSRSLLRPALGVSGVLVLLAGGIWLARQVMTESRPDDLPSVDLDPDFIAVMPFHYVGNSDALKTVAQGIPALFTWRVTGEFGPRAANWTDVERLWTRAGGALETQIPEEEALSIGQTVGAGRLVDGMVTGTEAHMTLTARLLEVPSGRVRVRPVTVEGPYDSFPTLVQNLIDRLLATDWGSWTAVDLPELSRYAPEVVQAYLYGDLEEAFALDSSFYFAGILLYRDGENDQALARYLWDHRDELRPMDRAELTALAGWRFGATRTLAERFAQYDSATELGGGREYLSEVASQLWEQGSRVNEFRYRDRAKAAFLRWRQLGRANPGLLLMLSDIAAAEGDTAAIRLYAEEVAPLASSTADSVDAATVRLRAALAQGDSAGADRIWEQIDAIANSIMIDPDPLLVLLVDGRGLEALDRFMISEMETQQRNFRSGVFWARARGRYSYWTASRNIVYDHEYFNRFMPLIGPVLRVRDALFLGEPEDSSVLAAVSRLDSVVAGQINILPQPNDPTPEIRAPALARCWSTLWRVAHGDTRGAAEAIRYLREDVPLPYRYSVCAGIIDVLVADRVGGDLRSAVARLDSIVGPVPMEPGNWYLTRDGTPWVDNLFLSRKLLQVGDTAGALVAARRDRAWNSWLPAATGGLFVDLLREEARLTAMVGDTAGAIDTYEHWLTLRDRRPDGQRWAAQWDSVRTEYAALTGVDMP